MIGRPAPTAKKQVPCLVFALALGGTAAVAAAAATPSPVIDNDRVTVWDVTTTLPPAAHDFLALSYPGKGSVTVGHPGETPGHADQHTVVIELKNAAVTPLANASGYPNAFPRPRVEKVLETDKLIVWRYRWNPGEITPMHFHDKDVVVVYGEDTVLESTTPDGKSTVNSYKAGEIRFNKRDRVHSERLMNGAGSAMITELK
ncbi:MAG: hypothetical protein ABSF94_07810 [Steroidobacteraceae bacterium]|jgi:hypothetical protein